jgi:uncharacterized protein
MLRDDRTDGGGRRAASRNVLGEPLEICSIKPMTGFYRDGCWREDFGSHTVCAVLTSAFLEFSKSRGNDLSTPMPEFGFPGLRPGDRWCLSSRACYRLQASLEMDQMSSLRIDGGWRIGLAAVIEDTSGHKSYWALAHPPGKADFHHSDSFALQFS